MEAATTKSEAAVATIKDEAPAPKAVAKSTKSPILYNAQPCTDSCPHAVHRQPLYYQYTVNISLHYWELNPGFTANELDALNDLNSLGDFFPTQWCKFINGTMHTMKNTARVLRAEGRPLAYLRSTKSIAQGNFRAGFRIPS